MKVVGPGTWPRPRWPPSRDAANSRRSRISRPGSGRRPSAATGSSSGTSGASRPIASRSRPGMPATTSRPVRPSPRRSRSCGPRPTNRRRIASRPPVRDASPSSAGACSNSASRRRRPMRSSSRRNVPTAIVEPTRCGGRSSPSTGSSSPGAPMPTTRGRDGIRFPPASSTRSRRTIEPRPCWFARSWCRRTRARTTSRSSSACPRATRPGSSRVGGRPRRCTGSSEAPAPASAGPRAVGCWRWWTNCSTGPIATPGSSPISGDSTVSCFGRGRRSRATSTCTTPSGPLATSPRSSSRASAAASTTSPTS